MIQVLCSLTADITCTCMQQHTHITQHVGRLGYLFQWMNQQLPVTLDLRGYCVRRTVKKTEQTLQRLEPAAALSLDGRFQSENVVDCSVGAEQHIYTAEVTHKVPESWLTINTRITDHTQVPDS